MEANSLKSKSKQAIMQANMQRHANSFKSNDKQVSKQAIKQANSLELMTCHSNIKVNSQQNSSPNI